MSEITVIDLGRMSYREAWERQERAHEAVLGGGGETIFIVEHTPVVTLGRRGETPGNLLSSVEELARKNIDFIHSDRGGDITYHGLGQIVAYPIIRLADHQLSVSGYVHRLESIIIETLKEIGIEAYTDPQAIGVWAGDGKIAAIGVRIRRGISLHGLALNVDMDLNDFNHIVPCGLVGRGVTSVRKILRKDGPSFAEVKEILIRHLSESLHLT